MKKNIIKSVVSIISIFTIIVSFMSILASCSKNNENSSTAETTTAVSSQTTEAQTEESTSSAAAEIIGEGATTVNLTVTFLDGSKKSYTVKTDETTLGEALIKLKLISGEQGSYGLYIKTVAGETLDYDTDGAYWALYIDGEYALTGADQTNIENGKIYELRAEKA